MITEIEKQASKELNGISDALNTALIGAEYELKKMNKDKFSLQSVAYRIILNRYDNAKRALKIFDKLDSFHLTNLIEDVLENEK